MRTPFNQGEVAQFSVGGRTINKDWFGMPTQVVWDILSEQLYFAVHAFGLKIHLFVLMSNHFHMIVTAHPEQLSIAMQYMLTQSSRLIAKPTGRINHIWKSRFYRRRIGSPIYYLHAYKYFYRNPVEAGIVGRVEEYRFSTLHGLLGQTHLLIPVAYDGVLFSDVEGTLEWLNSEPLADHKIAVKRALKRVEFKLAKLNRRPHPLEIESY